MTRRASLGETREVDRIKARVEWLKQQRELRAAEREAAAAESALRTLAASPLPKPLVVSGQLPGPADAADSLRDAVPDRLERSPEMIRVRAEAARASSLLSSTRRSRVPDLAFSVFGQKELDRDAFGVSIGVVLPLWNARRGDVARSGAESRLRAAEAERLRLVLLTEVETRRRDVDTSAAEVATLMNDLITSAAESLRLARILFEEGETSLLDLLDAQRTARDARREEIRARFELSVALSEFHRLLGPGDPTSIAAPQGDTK
jgi:outer membrane protein TolC